MKRMFVLLVAAVIALSFSACGSDTEAAIKPSADEGPLITTPSAEIGAHGELIFEGSTDKCLFENESCSLILNKAEIDSLSDYCWSVTLINHTASTQIFTFKRAYVNDFDFDPLWVEQVEPYETVETSIIWESPYMQDRGILQVTRVDFDLCVYAADAKDTVYADADITVYPSFKSAHITQLRSRVTTDIDVVDNAEAKFVIIGYDDASRWGKALDVYACNKTDERLVFTLENVMIEDQENDPKWSYTLDGGKQGMSQIVWFDSALEDLQIDGGLEFEYELVISSENGEVLARIPHTFVP